MIKALFFRVFFVVFLLFIFFGRLSKSNRVYASDREEMITYLGQLLDDAWYESDGLRMSDPEEFKVLASVLLSDFDEARNITNPRLLSLQEENYWKRFKITDDYFDRGSMGGWVYWLDMLDLDDWNGFTKSNIKEINWALFFAVAQVENGLMYRTEQIVRFNIHGLVNAHTGQAVRELISHYMGFESCLGSNPYINEQRVNAKQLDELILTLMVYQGRLGGGDFSALGGGGVNQSIFRQYCGGSWVARGNAMYGAISKFVETYSEYDFLFDNIISDSSTLSCEIGELSGRVERDFTKYEDPVPKYVKVDLGVGNFMSKGYEISKIEGNYFDYVVYYPVGETSFSPSLLFFDKVDVSPIGFANCSPTEILIGRDSQNETDLFCDSKIKIKAKVLKNDNTGDFDFNKINFKLFGKKTIDSDLYLFNKEGSVWEETIDFFEVKAKDDGLYGVYPSLWKDDVLVEHSVPDSRLVTDESFAWFDGMTPHLINFDLRRKKISGRVLVFGDEDKVDLLREGQVEVIHHGRVGVYATYKSKMEPFYQFGRGAFFYYEVFLPFVDGSTELVLETRVKINEEIVNIELGRKYVFPSETNTTLDLNVFLDGGVCVTFGGVCNWLWRPNWTMIEGVNQAFAYDFPEPGPVFGDVGYENVGRLDCPILKTCYVPVCSNHGACMTEGECGSFVGGRSLGELDCGGGNICCGSREPVTSDPIISSVSYSLDNRFGDFSESSVLFLIEGDNFILNDEDENLVCIRELNDCYRKPRIREGATKERLELVLSQELLYDHIVNDDLSFLSFTVYRNNQE